jgi:hypothetical protein
MKKVILAVSVIAVSLTTILVSCNKTQVPNPKIEEVTLESKNGNSSERNSIFVSSDRANINAEHIGDNFYSIDFDFEGEKLSISPSSFDSDAIQILGVSKQKNDIIINYSANGANSSLRMYNIKRGNDKTSFLLEGRNSSGELITTEASIGTDLVANINSLLISGEQLQKIFSENVGNDAIAKACPPCFIVSGIVIIAIGTIEHCTSIIQSGQIACAAQGKCWTTGVCSVTCVTCSK